MATAKKKFVVSPSDGSESYTVEAEHYTFDKTTGRHLFENGKGASAEIVANLINVSVRQG